MWPIYFYTPKKHIQQLQIATICLESAQLGVLPLDKKDNRDIQNQNRISSPNSASYFFPTHFSPHFMNHCTALELEQ